MSLIFLGGPAKLVAVDRHRSRVREVAIDAVRQEIARLTEMGVRVIRLRVSEAVLEILGGVTEIDGVELQPRRRVRIAETSRAKTETTR